MRELQERSIDCPYCGESMEVFVEPSAPQQDYIEDCRICCRPINLRVTVESDGNITLLASSDSD